MYECMNCHEPVTTAKYQSLMIYRYGMTMWVHENPYDWQNPEDCKLFPRAIPDFNKPVELIKH